jgi:hypothetical protein
MAEARLSRKARLRAADRADCGAVGERFELGAVEAVTRDLDDSNGFTTLGGCAVGLCFLGLCVALPVVAGVTRSGADSLITAEACGALLAAGVIALVIGHRRAAVRRLCLYYGGLARLDERKPEPEVLRWADVETVTISSEHDEGDPKTGLAGCTVRGRSGTEFTVPVELLAATAKAVHRNVAPRIASAMIYAYDAGQPAICGNAEVDPQGVTLPDGKRLAWADLDTVELQPPSATARGVTTRIDFTLAGQRKRRAVLDPTDIPNAIFLADLVAHAARQRGLTVLGYEPQDTSR